MAFRHGSVKNAVEYDGDSHYRDSLRIKLDKEKDEIAEEQGYRVVRFPYWVQLDSVTLKHYFELESQIKIDFPHGFITTRIFPASFCEMGTRIFVAQLNSLPETVRKKVVDSLLDRSLEYGKEYVLPKQLWSIIS